MLGVKLRTHAVCSSMSTSTEHLTRDTCLLHVRHTLHLLLAASLAPAKRWSELQWSLDPQGLMRSWLPPHPLLLCCLAASLSAAFASAHAALAALPFQLPAHMEASQRTAIRQQENPSSVMLLSDTFGISHEASLTGKATCLLVEVRSLLHSLCFFKPGSVLVLSPCNHNPSQCWPTYWCSCKAQVGEGMLGYDSQGVAV
jgi:hypothetical protein